MIEQSISSSESFLSSDEKKHTTQGFCSNLTLLDKQKKIYQQDINKFKKNAFLNILTSSILIFFASKNNITNASNLSINLLLILSSTFNLSCCCKNLYRLSQSKEMLKTLQKLLKKNQINHQIDKDIFSKNKKNKLNFQRPLPKLETIKEEENHPEQISVIVENYSDQQFKKIIPNPIFK